VSIIKILALTSPEGNAVAEVTFSHPLNPEEQEFIDGAKGEDDGLQRSISQLNHLTKPAEAPQSTGPEAE